MAGILGKFLQFRGAIQNVMSDAGRRAYERPEVRWRSYADTKRSFLRPGNAARHWTMVLCRCAAAVRPGLTAGSMLGLSKRLSARHRDRLPG